MRIFACLCICFCLTSCYLFAPTVPGTATGTYNPELAKAKKPLSLNQWTINGRMALTTPKQNHTASVYWRQRGKQFNMQFIAPLGVGAVRLFGSSNRVTFINANGQRFSAGSGETLLRQQMGWRIPVSNLYYWIRGVPSPGYATEKKYDKNGDLARLEQQGWRIRYLNYAKFGAYALPTRIFLTYGNLKLRIIITRWQV